MKGKFWAFIAMFLGGIIAGLIAADKLSMGVETIYKGNFRFKLKGKGNTQTTEIKPEIVQEDRKLGRIQRKLEKEKEKVQKKMQKQHRNSGKPQ